jgi:RND family efflux transporter MFP subunit
MAANRPGRGALYPEKSMLNRDADILRHRTPPRLKQAGFIALGVAAAIVAVGLGVRFYNASHTRQWTADQQVTSVELAALSGAKGGAELTLPGAVEAFNSAPIFARVSGYLKKWYVDIGTPVKAGQVLADLDSPDLDAQLAQGKADLNTAIANQQLSAATQRRWDSLFAQGAVSRQDKDTKDSDLAAKNAIVASARSNVARLEAMESFKHLTAPFAGVVTSRAVDIGALVLVGTPGATPLFTIADQSRLRIYVRVPQTDEAALKPGVTATFTVPEFPNRSFTATLAAAAGAIASQSGTQLAQFVMDNPGGLIKPGDYAEVHLKLPSGNGMVRIPATALLLRDKGLMVATVDATDHVRLKPIKVGADLGTEVQAVGGVSLTDRVIDNPADSIHDGDLVHVIPKNPTKED